MGSTGYKWAQMSLVCPDGARCAQMGPDGSEWLKMEEQFEEQLEAELEEQLKEQFKKQSKRQLEHLEEQKARRLALRRHEEQARDFHLCFK